MAKLRKKAVSALLNSKHGKSIVKPAKKAKSLKPLRARQLIRRFHILLKYKSQLIHKLGSSETTYLKDINYKQLRDKYDGSFRNVMDKLEVNKTPNSDHGEFPSGNECEIICSLGAIDGEIEKRGGIETYQQASTLGQDGKRGGDSSKQLIEWFGELGITKLNNALEIGCLSCKNFISTSGIFKEIKRIDLNSQDPLILEQDFLKRPIPQSDDDKFNLISCSLVLNFVPRAEDRGLMIKLFPKFLISEGGYLFLVLPLPCIDNSRYITKDSLFEIFKSQGLHVVKEKETHKLHYVLFQWDGRTNDKFHFKKEQVKMGGKRNNFSIVL